MLSQNVVTEGSTCTVPSHRTTFQQYRGKLVTGDRQQANNTCSKVCCLHHVHRLLRGFISSCACQRQVVLHLWVHHIP
jgi:hypothetical protein